MDLKNVDNQIETGTKIFDRIWDFIATRWWKIIVLLFLSGIGYFIYLVVSDDAVVEEPYIIETYEDINANGETVLIDVWSDGVETEQ
jgi:hypothetical protein